MPPPTTTAHLGAELLGGDQLAAIRSTVAGRYRRTGCGRYSARQFDHHPTIDRLSHGELFPYPRGPASGAGRAEALSSGGYFLPLAARDLGGKIGFLDRFSPRA